jgi:hypothetical protein
MTSLAGRTLIDTYKDLLQISNSNSGVDTTARYIEDGEGTPSILSLSTTNVGISTTTPTSILQINSDGDSSNQYSIFKLGNPTWNQAGGCGFSFHKRDSDNWAGVQINTENDNAMAIMIRNTSKAPNPSFEVTGDGLIAHCAGINLGSTNVAAANTLDDYETGLFTPVLNTIENNVVESYSSSTVEGQYTKIGNMVHVLIRLSKNSTHTDATQESGRLIVTNLPFTRSDFVTVQAAGSWWLDNGDQGTDLTGVSYVNAADRIYLTRTTTTVGGRYVRGNEMGASRHIYINATYYTS